MNKDSNPAIPSPSGIGAPEPTEIEITPAMIRAAIDVFRNWDPKAREPEMFVAEIYVAMQEVLLRRKKELTQFMSD